MLSLAGFLQCPRRVISTEPDGPASDLMSAFLLQERPNSAWRRNTRAELLATNFHFTTPHADTSRFMQNMSIMAGSGCAASAIHRSQSSSDAKVGVLCIGWQVCTWTGGHTNRDHEDHCCHWDILARSSTCLNCAPRGGFIEGRKA